MFSLSVNNYTNNLISDSMNTNNMNVDSTATSDHIKLGIFEKPGILLYFSKIIYL